MKYIVTSILLTLFISGCADPMTRDESQQAQNQSVIIEKTPLIPRAIEEPNEVESVKSIDLDKNTDKCVDYESPVNRAVLSRDLESLEKLLVILDNLPDCHFSYLDGVKRSTAQIAAVRADELTQQGQLTEAKAWLQRAPTMVWGTQVVHGDIAARRQQWQTAALFYNQAIDLIADIQSTPNAPPAAVIKQVYQLASESQILAGGLVKNPTQVSSSVDGRGTMRGKVRDFVPAKLLIPIQFNAGKMTLNQKGKQAARRLANYLKQQNVVEATLIGHTDSKGSHAVNDKISKKRALAVKKYLQKNGVTTKISVYGKGKREPLPLANRAIYTPADIDTLNRRVELIAN